MSEGGSRAEYDVEVWQLVFVLQEVVAKHQLDTGTNGKLPALASDFLVFRSP